MCFIPDNSTRRHLVPPTQIGVDFRAACFCHKRIVDIGFVCSICLSSQFPISSFLKPETAIMQRHRYYFRALERQVEGKGKEKQEELESLEQDGDFLESWESSTEDINTYTTLLIDWWFNGVRPTPIIDEKRWAESGVFREDNEAPYDTK